MAAGHLDKYIEGGTQPSPQDHNNPNGLPIDVPPQGIINVIHGVFEPERVCELRGSIKKVEHLREVLSAQPAIKKGKTEATYVMSFSDKDLDRIFCHDKDALGVSLRGKDFDVKRILIDQGSSCEIMYYETFKQLKLQDKVLAPAVSPLIGFNSKPEWPIGKIILPVRAGSVTKQVEFWVLKVPSTYNIILGRTCLFAIRLVASSYYLVMRFPNDVGIIEEVYGVQIMSKLCFVTANGSRAAKGYVNSV